MFQFLAAIAASVSASNAFLVGVQSPQYAGATINVIVKGLLPVRSSNLSTICFLKFSFRIATFSGASNTAVGSHLKDRL